MTSLLAFSSTELRMLLHNSVLLRILPNLQHHGKPPLVKSLTAHFVIFEMQPSSIACCVCYKCIANTQQIALEHYKRACLCCDTMGTPASSAYMCFHDRHLDLTVHAPLVRGACLIFDAPVMFGIVPSFSSTAMSTSRQRLKLLCLSPRSHHTPSPSLLS